MSRNVLSDGHIFGIMMYAYKGLQVLEFQNRYDIWNQNIFDIFTTLSVILADVKFGQFEYLSWVYRQINNLQANSSISNQFDLISKFQYFDFQFL